MKHSVSQRVISTLLALLVVLGSFAVSAAAATTEEEYGGSYGYIIPTDLNLSAQKESYTFYGNSTTLYFMLFSNGRENSFYTVDIFSSDDYNPDNIVSSFTSQYNAAKGSVPLALNWPFKANPSGTYYGRCYTSIINGEDEIIDKSTICKFTIKLNRVGKETVSLTSITNKPDGVTIKWTGLSTALKYRVYRKVKGDKKWTAIGDVKAGTTSFTDKKVQSGVQYTYTVKAFDNLYASLYDKAGLTTVFLATPTLTPSKASTSIYPVIKWSQVQGCQGYIVYRKGGSLNDSTKWKQVAKIKSPTTLTYTDKTATSADWKYSYTVRAYYGNFKSYYNTTGVDYEYVTAPTLKSASSVYGGVNITWLDTNTVNKKFNIYRKAPGEKKWTKIGSSKKTSFVDKKVTNGTAYTYTVRTVSSTNASSYDTKGVSTMYITTPELSKISIAKNGAVTVKWSAVAGAKGYIVYKSTNGAKWVQIAKITNPKTLTYKDTSAKKTGEKYTYTVRAFNGSYKSYYVKAGISTMFLTTPTVTAKNDYTVEQGSCVKVSWDSIVGAKSYRVYRKAATDKSWTMLADDVTDKVYYDKTAESGVKYYYTARAKNGSFLSGYTSTELITVLSTPILQDAVNTTTGVKITWTGVGGADSYNVFRRTISGAWENIGTTTSNEFIDSSENATTTSYLYTVRANSGDLKSTYMINGIANFASLENLDVLFEENKEANTAFITVTWKGTGADSYEIYRSENGSSPTLLATVPATETQNYIDKTIVQGSAYTYTVKPIKQNKLSIALTSESIKWEHPPITMVPVIAIPYYADADTSDRIEIHWEAVEAAESYDIYRKTDDSEWTYLATVGKDDSYIYIDTTIDTDITYYYSVKGIAPDRDSLFDDKGTASLLKGPIEPITDMFVQLSDDPTGSGKKQVTIAWEAKEHVTLYKIMRKTGDGDWKFLSFVLSCDTLVYTDTSIEQGVTYTYAIHTLAPDRTSINNTVGKSIIWPADNPPAEDTTTGSGDEATKPDTSEPDTSAPEATEPTTKPEETTGESK